MPFTKPSSNRRSRSTPRRSSLTVRPIPPAPPMIGRRWKGLQQWRSDMISSLFPTKSMRRSFMTTLGTQHRHARTGRCRPHGDRQWGVKSLCDDRVAHRLCSWSEGPLDCHGEYSKPEHFESLLDLSESGGRRPAHRETRLRGRWFRNLTGVGIALWNDSIKFPGSVAGCRAGPFMRSPILPVSSIADGRAVC